MNVEFSNSIFRHLKNKRHSRDIYRQWGAKQTDRAHNKSLLQTNPLLTKKSQLRPVGKNVERLQAGSFREL